jgi:hypothetical protein
MSILAEHKIHGVASLYLWEALSEQLAEAHFHLAKGNSESRSSYVLTGIVPKVIGKGITAKAGVFIKYSGSRVSPWRYSFKKVDQDEIDQLNKAFGQVFVVLVNGDDGIACLDFANLKVILDEHHEEQEWVSISRKPRQNYRVAGNDGIHEKPLPKNSYPQVIVDFFKAKLNL